MMYGHRPIGDRGYGDGRRVAERKPPAETPAPQEPRDESKKEEPQP